MNLLEKYDIDNVIKISASNPAKRDCQFLRVVLKQVRIKNTIRFQAEKFTQKQVFHDNIPTEELTEYLNSNLVGNFKQICVVLPNKIITYLFSSSGKVKVLENAVATNPKTALSQNRRKKYLLSEGDNIPALVDLGIFTKEFKVVNSMYDKFKQINRFVEILDDVLKQTEQKEITLLDFGCGKSYLTFIIYHYLVNIRKINAKIIGYDLKNDVVENCNKLAIKYGCDNLHFIVADVTKDKLCEEKIDVVVSLHACDIATDYALNYAVQNNVPYIFSVPCCQHEVNSTINKGGDLDVLLKYGIVKERVSALLTDSIRALLLEDMGYSVDVMEFVDLSHSPKNLMIRAVKKHAVNNKNKAKIEHIMQQYGFTQKLYSLLYIH